MKCLIIAAGKGSRLCNNGDSKPLIKVLGVPLIERVIRSAMEAGADDFFVVTGYQEKNICEFLGGLAGRIKLPITTIFNKDWDKENGFSVLKAQEYLKTPFLLLMSDHLFDPAIAGNLMKNSLNGEVLALAVDKDLQNTNVNMEDVTCVKTVNGMIRNIGKDLTEFNGFDTGVFFCKPTFFDALKQCKEKSGDTTLSGAVKVLAEAGKVKNFDSSGLFWLDVDDPIDFKKAEKALLSDLKGKHNDGPVSRYINRPLSVRMSKWLVNYRVSPNQISLFSFFCSIVAACLFAFGNYFSLLLGGVLAQFASIIDGCDGEVARLKFQSSAFGGWFDAVLDRYADAFLLFGLTWHAYADKADNPVLLIGFLAIIGSFMLSYTADKYDGLMQNKISPANRFRLGRDVRVFGIFLGAIFGQVYLTLVVIAIVMNIETVRRVIVCRNHK